jgi:hypothetical protein
MNGDFARITFDPGSAYSRVLLQQGRMLLESDFNEQSAIHQHFLRSLVIDLVGRCWRAGEQSFSIAPGDATDFKIGAGRFYVDGIPCDNTRPDLTYRNQSPWGPLLDEEGPVEAGFLIYLECWERHLSAVQRPAIREIALGGPDTATRAKIEWQVHVLDGERAKRRADDAARALDARQKALPDGPEKTRAKADADALAAALDKFVKSLGKKPTAAQEKEACRTMQAMLDGLDAAGPSLRARARHDASEDDPCAISAEAEFRSRENQLYRIEIHRGGIAGVGGATFKWSRENGSVQFAVRSIAASKTGSTIQLDGLGHDRRTGLCEGNWVELTGDAVEFGRAAPVLGRIESIDRERESVTFVVADGETATVDPKIHTLLRRWDQSGELAASGSIAIAESASENDGWIALERGVEIQFAPGAIYNAGDYWVAAGRAASRHVEWPHAANGTAAWQPTLGTVRHRAALAVGRKGPAYQSCGCTVTSLCDQMET